MGLFGTSKIKITPIEFINANLDKIFSSNFIDMETKGFAHLSIDFPFLKEINFEKYLKERQNAICALFKIAWDRNAPYVIFMKYSLVMSEDPRVKAVSSEAYSQILSRAQEAGIDTFRYFSRIFILEAIAPNNNMKNEDYLKIVEMFIMDYTSLYISFETLVKQYKFI